jgi:hypothetical protein
MKNILIFLIVAMLCGCNTYNVKSLPYDPALKDVVVVHNPKVIVKDFVDVMTDEFNARKIKVRNVPRDYVSMPNEYVVHYDARQSWDFSLYLSDASIRIIKDGMTVGKGRYHHTGGSASLDIFTKWRGTEWKMKDLYEDLLKNYQPENN